MIGENAPAVGGLALLPLVPLRDSPVAAVAVAVLGFAQRCLLSPAGRSGLAWLACGPQLEVVNSVSGERLSAYRFGGVSEQPPAVRVVKEFSWQKRTGLLVGLEEAEGSVLCLYDLGISRVVKAVAVSGRVCIFFGKMEVLCCLVLHIPLLGKAL